MSVHNATVRNAWTVSRKILPQGTKQYLIYVDGMKLWTSDAKQADTFTHIGALNVADGLGGFYSGYEVQQKLV